MKAAHGTYAGLQAHTGLRTPVCDACREAGRQYARDRRRHSIGNAVNFPREVRADLRDMYGLGARIAESLRWSV